MCAVRALAMHLVFRFTIRGDDFPDPTKAEEWNNAALWPASDAWKNVTYAQMAKAFKEAFEAAEIFIKKKTHSGRMASACTLDISGGSQEVASNLFFIMSFSALMNH